MLFRSGGSGGGSGSGSEELNRKDNLIITPADCYKQYDDGNILKADNKIVGIDSFLKSNSGYTYQVEVSGERKNVGVSETTITSFKLFDADGNNVTDNYNIIIKPGKLYVYYSVITVVTDSVSGKYSGQPLRSEETPEASGILLPGHRIEVLKCNNSRTVVGVSENSATVKIVDENGYDVTYMYMIKGQYGTLIVEPLEITVIARSASKPYDGTSLECKEYDIDGELIDGDTLTAKIEGSITEIGRCNNVVVSVKIVDSNGTDVTQNYSVNIVDGKLKITR